MIGQVVVFLNGWCGYVTFLSHYPPLGLLLHMNTAVSVPALADEHSSRCGVGCHGPGSLLVYWSARCSTCPLDLTDMLGGIVLFFLMVQ